LKPTKAPKNNKKTTTTTQMTTTTTPDQTKVYRKRGRNFNLRDLPIICPLKFGQKMAERRKKIKEEYHIR